jgi:hypothetical protein
MTYNLFLISMRQSSLNVRERYDRPSLLVCWFIFYVCLVRRGLFSILALFLYVSSLALSSTLLEAGIEA